MQKIIKQSIKHHIYIFYVLTFFALFLTYSCQKQSSSELEQPKIEQEKSKQEEGNSKTNQEKPKTEQDTTKIKHTNPENGKNDNPTISKKVIFAKGVSKEKGWYDVDKQFTQQDVVSCWLITASNMLQWWQDRYIEKGNKLPINTPNGKGTGPYKLAIFDNAITKFNDLKYGGDIRSGFLWYIEGKNADITGHAYPKMNTGGYLKDIADKIEYSKRFFSSNDDWRNLKINQEVLKTFSEKLLGQLEKKATIGLDIKTHVGWGGVLHAITLWGAEVNDKNIVTAIYITDSDDAENKLVYCPIDIYENEITKKRDVFMKVPIGKTYDKERNWEILRMFYIYPPEK